MQKELQRISTANLIHMLDKVDEDLKLPVCFELVKRISTDNESFFKLFIDLYGDIHKENNKNLTK